jgi:hypothetical protein
MPINPNIALGIQPVQQPNILGQMAQVMAIRAAQEDLEGNVDVKNYFAKPVGERGDPTALLGSKRGQAAFKAYNEGQEKNLDIAKKNIELVGASAGAVLQNPTLENFTSVVSNLVNRGIYTPQQRDQAFAAIGGDPSKIKAFVTPIYEQAISAEKRLNAQTSIQTANIGAAAPMMNARLNQRQYEDKLAAGGDIVTTTIPDPENPKERIEIQTRRDLRTGQLIPLEVAPMPMRVDISPNSATSAFQPLGGGAGGTPNVLATQVAPQGGGAAAPIVNGLNPNAPQPQVTSFARPPAKEPSGTMAGYRKTADGKGLEFIPGGPADPDVQAKQGSVKLSAKDLANREAKFPQATSALKAFNAKTSKFERDIDELIANEKGLDEITGYLAGRTDLSAVSAEGRRALALFNTITAKGGFSELQDMRNASPTGGALGNVSNQEGKQLIDSFGALSRTQSGKDLRKSLITAKSDLQNLSERMGEAYDLTYEYKRGGSAASSGVIDFGSLK